MGLGGSAASAGLRQAPRERYPVFVRTPNRADAGASAPGP